MMCIGKSYDRISDMVYLKDFRAAMKLILLAMTLGLVSAGKNWAAFGNDHLHDNLVEERAPKSHVNRLDVVCSKDHMTVHMFFDNPFYGMVFSQPTHHQERCVHVGPRAGVREISFHIQYDSCGTVEDLSGQFHENTIVIQYGEDILEAWDEAKRLRCEWLESFDKESSKNSLAISEIDIVELNFQGDDIDCWMEVQEGKGPWARQVGGILPIGSPLTLVIAINDHSREFDMRVKKCVASDGSGSEVQLTDQNGCVLRPSLLTPFSKIRDFGGKATLVAYSHLFAFKFPDTLDVFVHCIVEVCRQGCPDSCDGSLLTEHHPYPREHFHTLETKKKVVELTTPNPSTIHSVQASHHHQRPQYLTKVPVHLLHSLTGKAKNAQQQSYVQNASLSLTSHPDLSKFGRISDEVNNRPIKKPDVPSSASNIYVVTEEDRNRVLNSGHEKVSIHPSNEQQAFSDVKPVPIGQYHKIIGHHAHWNSDEVRAKDEEYFKHHIPPLKGSSYQPLAHPDLDKVKSLSKEEILHQHFGLKKTNLQESLHLSQPPQPEPAAWSADDVRPLTKEEVFHKQFPNHHFKEPLTVPHRVVSHNDAFSHSKLPHFPSHISEEPPQPEPAAWSADDVRPLTKEEVFHKQFPNHHFKEPHTVPHHVVSHNDAFSNINLPHFPSHVSEEPKPEPAPWTFDEVRPMHNPAIRHQPETKRLPEPKPEPAAWTLDDVKPLTKEDLRLHSLNYKLKSHSHLSDPVPVYKESVLPYGTRSPSTAPSPVYKPKVGASAKNMSGAMMMNMMMMMPTLLPFTYQTARWPQKTTAYARNLRTNRHNHPYPIPQFTHKQQLMMSVIADRRSDEDEEDLQFVMDPRSAMNDQSSSTVNPEENHKQNTGSEDGISSHIVSMQSEESNTRSSMGTTQTESFMGDQVNTGSSDQSTTKMENPSAIRPPIQGFVAPSLDVGEINPFETKGQSAHSPRALNRRKRSSEPVFGVKQKFQAIALTDLAFEYNLTQDSTAVLRGRREEIIYGICMSPASMSLSVGFILLLTLCSLMASLLLYEHSYRLRNKTSRLSLLTRTFNGRLESLYRVSRHNPNSSVR